VQRVSFEPRQVCASLFFIKERYKPLREEIESNSKLSDAKISDLYPTFLVLSEILGVSTANFTRLPHLIH
jgi:hypothetical protein